MSTQNSCRYPQPAAWMCMERHRASNRCASCGPQGRHGPACGMSRVCVHIQTAADGACCSALSQRDIGYPHELAPIPCTCHPFSSAAEKCVAQAEVLQSFALCLMVLVASPTAVSPPVGSSFRKSSVHLQSVGQGWEQALAQLHTCTCAWTIMRKTGLRVSRREGLPKVCMHDLTG